jgi:hypothetical protein
MPPAVDSHEDRLHVQHEALWLRAWRVVLAYLIVVLVAAMVFAPPRVQGVVAYGCSGIVFLWIYFGDALLWRLGRRGRPQPVRA